MTWTIEADEDGYLHTRCPKCDTLDQIYELDRAVRWNRLSLIDETSATASLDDGEFDGDGWICGACQAEDLEAPDGFEIVDWS